MFTACSAVIFLVACSGHADAARKEAPPRSLAETGTPGGGIVAGEVDVQEGIMKLAEIFVLGLNAISSAILVFTDDPLDVELGVATIRQKMWKVVLKIVPEELHQSDRMLAAERAYDEAFSNVPDVTSDIMAFRSTGNTENLLRAIKNIISTALTSCAAVFPEQADYFTALRNVIEGVGESWVEFSRGDTLEAVEKLWGAMVASVNDVLPKELLNDEYYSIIMNTMDGVISRLSHHVLEYKRSILTSKVCYRQSQHRERTRPTQCREGFAWDQATLCIPEGSGNGANCFPPCGHQAGMCDSFCGEGMACCKQGGNSADALECEGAHGFVDHAFTYGTSWDYHQCVRPGPNLAFTVTGAGLVAVNGLYVQSGSHSGRPRYTKVRNRNTVLEWSNRRGAWRMFVDTTTFGFRRLTLYTSAEDTPTFPTTGWKTEDGVQPSPSIEPYVEEEVAEGSSLQQANAGPAQSPSPGVYGSHEASCELESEYTEKLDGWCLTHCPEGFEPKGLKCVQACGGEYPAKGYGYFVCGREHEDVNTAMSEMMTIVTNGAITAFTLVEKTLEDGVHGETLSNTINVFIDMGKPFARPECPVG